ncbi:MAG: hypothetical protein WA849_13805 [Candidatus Udaeobacter sp.]
MQAIYYTIVMVTEMTLTAAVKNLLANNYISVMITAFLQEVSGRGASAVAMKWIGRSSLWSGLRLPFRPTSRDAALVEDFACCFLLKLYQRTA